MSNPLYELVTSPPEVTKKFLAPIVEAVNREQKAVVDKSKETKG